MDFTSGVGLGLDVLNAGVNIYNAVQAKKKYDYDKSIQQQIFDREDTALQRRMADAEKAGLNPYSVATGSGAGAGSVVSTTAPNMNAGFSLDNMQASIQMAQAKAQTENLKAQENAIKANTRKVNAEADVQEAIAFNSDLIRNINRIQMELGIGQTNMAKQDLMDTMGALFNQTPDLFNPNYKPSYVTESGEVTRNRWIKNQDLTNYQNDLNFRQYLRESQKQQLDFGLKNLKGDKAMQWIDTISRALYMGTGAFNNVMGGVNKIPFSVPSAPIGFHF